MTLPLAQSGLSFLIYLIVGIFWLVGNILQQKQAKQKAEEMKRRREEREREEARTGKKPSKAHPLERDLETLLGNLSGEPPAPKPVSPPPVPRRRPEPAIQFDTAPPPPVTPIAEPPKTRSNIGKMDLADSFEEIEDLKDAVEISYEQLEGEVRAQALDTVRQVMVDLSPTMIDLPRLPVPSMRTVSTRSTPPDLRKRSAFKKAIMAGALLGPPAALKDPQSDAR